MKKKQSVTIEINNAQKVCDDLADLLCWWSGFKIGMKINSENCEFIIAEHGIEAAKDLKIKISDRLSLESVL
jgi:hypothetical protein